MNEESTKSNEKDNSVAIQKSICQSMIAACTYAVIEKGLTIAIRIMLSSFGVSVSKIEDLTDLLVIAICGIFLYHVFKKLNI